VAAAVNVWRGRLHRWFAPLAARCPLSPNAISILALLLNVVAAWLLYRREFLLAILFLGIGGLADAFDGIVARVQNKASQYGDFLDHFADRVSDAHAAAGVIVVMLNGYIGTQIEATWHERNYDAVGRGEFVLALVIFPLVSHIVSANRWSGTAPLGLTIAEWMTIVLIVFALLGIAQRFALAARLSRP
jgi:phosphatidylglycerophosphate synthase